MAVKRFVWLYHLNHIVSVLAKFAKPEIGKVGWGGWHSGENARLPPIWPGFDFWSRCHM